MAAAADTTNNKVVVAITIIVVVVVDTKITTSAIIIIKAEVVSKTTIEEVEAVEASNFNIILNVEPDGIRILAVSESFID